MYYDISMTLSENVQVYKNKPDKMMKIKNHSNFQTSSVYETDIEMNLHTGTHIDFPLHIIKDGKDSTGFDLDRLLTKVKVLDFTHLTDKITKDDLFAYVIDEGDFLLFKTKNSFSEEFDFDFIYLDSCAADYLVSRNISGVGTDGLGIERAQEGHPTHHLLLENDIIIMEGLRLKDVEAGSYDMICLPLKIENTEALPVRAILKK
ncbi:MAG: cyclase family protein [Candidatus Izemoplasmatales bacterium]